MNVKKEVLRRIIEKLEQEREQVRRKIFKNLSTFKALVREQTILKREAAALDSLIKELGER